MSILPKAIYRFNAIPTKLPMVFFTELEQNFTICMETQKTSNSQSNLEKEEWNWRNQPAWLQALLQSHNHQDSMVLAQRNIDQWNKIESPEINPCTYGHLIFDKGGKNIQCPIDGSPPGSAVPGILQARTLEWVAISFSNALKWKVKGKSLGHVRRSATPWTAAQKAPPSMGFSRQVYWSGVPLPSPLVQSMRLQKSWTQLSN